MIFCLRTGGIAHDAYAPSRRGRIGLGLKAGPTTKKHGLAAFRCSNSGRYFMTNRSRASLLAATAIGIIWASPSWAQAPAPAQQPATPKTETAQQAQSDQAEAGNDIIVTARRVTERLQDVPISIT